MDNSTTRYLTLGVILCAEFVAHVVNTQILHQKPFIWEKRTYENHILNNCLTSVICFRFLVITRRHHRVLTRHQGRFLLSSISSFLNIPGPSNTVSNLSFYIQIVQNKMECHDYQDFRVRILGSLHRAL